MQTGSVYLKLQEILLVAETGVTIEDLRVGNFQYADLEDVVDDTTSTDILDGTLPLVSEEDAIRAKDITDLEKYPTGSKSGLKRPVTIWMRICYRAVKKAQHRDRRFFPGPCDASKKKTFAKLDTEDIARWFAFVVHVNSRQRSAIRNKTGVTDAIDKCDPAHRRTSGLHNVPAIPPLYKLRASNRRATAAELKVQGQAQAKLLLHEKMNSQRPELRGVRVATENTNSADKMEQILAKLVTRSMAATGKGKQTKGAAKGPGLAAIDPKYFKEAVNTLTANLDILYDRSEEQARKDTFDSHEVQDVLRYGLALGDFQQTAMEGEEQQQLDRVDWRAELQQRLKADREFAKAVQTAFGDPGKVAADDLKGVYDEVKVQQSFRALQSRINALSAVPPSFDECIKSCGMIESPNPDGTNVPIVKSHTGVTYIPHQVQGVGFCTGMLTSPARSGVLADETGLGKTIEGLGANDAINRKIRNAITAAGSKLPPKARQFPARELVLQSRTISHPGNCLFVFPGGKLLSTWGFFW